MLKRLKEFVVKNKKLVILFSLFLAFLLVLLLGIFFSREETIEKPTYEIPIIVEAPKYEKYLIEMEDTLLRKLNRYGDIYPTYSVKIIDHFEWAEKFAEKFKSKDLQYREQAFPAIPGCDLHTLDQTRHYWENDDEYILYDLATDILTFKFDNPMRISNIEIDPRDASSIERGLAEINREFFSENFEYKIEEATTEGNFYKIEFARVLDDLPILLRTYPLYILLAPDGSLKEGRFLLAEFDERGTKNVALGEELLEGLRDASIGKTIAFEFLNESDYENFDEYFLLFSVTGDEYGSMNLFDGSLYYYYFSKFDEIIEPKFLLFGEGILEIEGEQYNSSFEVFSNSN